MWTRKERPRVPLEPPRRARAASAEVINRMRTEDGLLRHVAVGTRPRDVNGVRSGDLLIGTRAFHGCLTILVNFSRRGAEGLNPRAAGAAKGSINADPK